MRTLLASSLALVLFAVPSIALAQGPAATPPAAPSGLALEGSAGPALNGVIITDEQPKTPIALSGACTLRSYDGFERADAVTAARLVCSDLQREGLKSAADVHLSRLGTKVVIAVSDVGGARERRLMLSGIEEVSVASPRVAKAYVHQTSEEETADIDNIVGEEERARKSRPGQMHVALGVVGAVPVGGPSTPGGGLAIAPIYDTASRISFGVDFRFATQSDFNQVGAGAFARYYFTSGAIAPWAGGGLAWTWIKVAPESGFSGSKSGLAPFVEGGVEMARTSKARFNVGVRVEIPTFSLEGSKYIPGPTVGSYGSYQSEKSYVVPVSLTVGAIF